MLCSQILLSQQLAETTVQIIKQTDTTDVMTRMYDEIRICLEGWHDIVWRTKTSFRRLTA
jgi:hypothetical protein